LKHFLILFFCFSSLLSKNYELQLYETIFTNLFHKKTIKLYTDNPSLFYKNKVFVLQQNCLKADLLIISNFNKLPKKCLNKPIFTTSYKKYLDYQVIGAFYWRKGRPQLKFNIKNLKKYKLFLNQTLKGYAK